MASFEKIAFTQYAGIPVSRFNSTALNVLETKYQDNF